MKWAFKLLQVLWRGVCLLFITLMRWLGLVSDYPYQEDQFDHHNINISTR